MPWNETIQICLDTLYRDPSIETPKIPEALLQKLLMKATTEVVFSFNGQLYRQIDGVAMGLPLGPILANIFLCKLETLISEGDMPLF